MEFGEIPTVCRLFTRECVSQCNKGTECWGGASSDDNDKKVCIYIYRERESMRLRERGRLQVIFRGQKIDDAVTCASSQGTDKQGLYGTHDSTLGVHKSTLDVSKDQESQGGDSNRDV